MIHQIDLVTKAWWLFLSKDHEIHVLGLLCKPIELVLGAELLRIGVQIIVVQRDPVGRVVETVHETTWWNILGAPVLSHTEARTIGWADEQFCIPHRLLRIIESKE